MKKLLLLISAFCFLLIGAYADTTPAMDCDDNLEVVVDFQNSNVHAVENTVLNNHVFIVGQNFLIEGNKRGPTFLNVDYFSFEFKPPTNLHWIDKEKPDY